MKNLFAIIAGRRSVTSRPLSTPVAAPYSQYGSRPHVLVLYQCHRSLLIDLRRLVAQRRLAEEMNPSVLKPREYSVESLKLIESLIPFEPQSVIMESDNHQLISRFVRAELTELMHNRVSPFWDKPKSFVFDDLLRTIQILESAILITPCLSMPTN